MPFSFRRPLFPGGLRFLLVETARMDDPGNMSRVHVCPFDPTRFPGLPSVAVQAIYPPFV